MLVIGNWKMNKTIAESAALARRLRPTAKIRGVTVVLAPSFTSLDGVRRAIAGSGIGLAAQNVYFEKQGAYTGEVSPSQIRDAGCTMALIGHSERRHIIGEPEEWTGRKVRSALDVGLVPVICVGETLAERKGGETIPVLERQLKTGFDRVSAKEIRKCVVAYEPVWAIGTGLVANRPQIEAALGTIRAWLREAFGPDAARGIPILYGGSVTPENIGDLATIEGMGGVLVGGASLAAEPFAAIAAACGKSRSSSPSPKRLDGRRRLQAKSMKRRK